MDLAGARELAKRLESAREAVGGWRRLEVVRLYPRARPRVDELRIYVQRGGRLERSERRRERP
ncbi:MAG TPA: hypothetical protein VFW80_09840 [Gaiellaceae bacterium]|nr:hypothetical protein [Gaiellaceae bacterium]